VGLSPHIFRVAADAYGFVRQFHADACVLVTGESGAGKTESAKHLMRFVTAVYVMHAPSLRNS
jgi:myosin-1